MFSRTTYENSRAGGIGVLEIAGENKAGAKEIIFAALRRTELTGEMAGPLASLCLAQTYRFSKEQCDQVLEARYRFPLPGDAAVTGVTVTFGETEIKTELKDRQEARDEYKEAKKKGEKAVLVTRESPDVFTICIAGLEPDMDVRVETHYVQMAQAEGVGWTARIPLTTVPRYVRKDEYSSRHAHGQPLAVLRDPGHRFTMDILIHGVRSVESPTHRLNTAIEGESLRVRLQEGEIVPDRDCVLAWRPMQDEKQPLLRVMAQEGEADTYFLAWLTPPVSQNVRKVPGEYIILVDHSGSMCGAKWEAADWAVEKFLLSLGEDDHFTLGLFHHTTKWYSRNLVSASQDSVRQAVQYLKANRDNGGTELGVALEQALNVKKLKGNVARNVLIITDAEVTDEGRILRLVSDEAARAERRRISLLCIDAAPNSFLASQIAEKGGGIAKFLTSDPNEGDISTTLDNILEDWKSPVLAGMKLLVDRQGLGASNRNVRALPDGRPYIDLGELAAGRTAWVSGKVTGKIGEGIGFGLIDGAGHSATTLSLKANDNVASLKSLYGARKLIGLELLIHARYAGDDLRRELIALGYDPEATLNSDAKASLYPENRAVNEVEALRGFIVRESLRFGLPSSETALIAVYHKAGKPVEATALVPNALPSGWDESFETVQSRIKMSPQYMLSDSINRQMPAPMMKRSAKDFGLHKKCSSVLMEDIGVESSWDRDTMIYAGTPAFVNGEAILFDSAASPDTIKNAGTIVRLKVAISGRKPASVDPGLSILVYVDDLTVPRAKVRLADLLKQHGVRPLNIAVGGAMVRIVLVDPAGAWSKGAPKLEVSLGLR